MAGIETLISVRELVQLVLISLFGLLIQQRLFRENPASRRVLLLGVVTVLLLVPLTWLTSPLQVPLPVVSAPTWLNDATLSLPLVLILVVPGLIRAGNVGIRAFFLQSELLDQEKSQDSRLNSLVLNLCYELRFPWSVHVLVAPDRGPASGTLIRPLLILPEEVHHWSDTTLRAMLAHEFVHMRRRDDAWLMLVRCLTSFYWWLPWLCVFERRLIEAMEESCDDQAGQLQGDFCYLEGVVNVLRRPSSQNEASYASELAGMAWLKGQHLVQRFRRFRELRFLETDSHAVYWSLLGVVSVSTVLAGVQPVVRPLPEDEMFKNTSRLPITQSVRGPQVEFRAAPVGSNPALAQRLQTTVGMERPLYPGMALKAGISGDVTVAFDLAADGSVTRARVVRSTHPALSAPALEAAERSQFPPLHTIPVLRLEEIQRERTHLGAGTGSAQAALLYFSFELGTGAETSNPAKYWEK